MKSYLFKAKNSKGQIVTGKIKAESPATAENTLARKNFVLMDLTPEKDQIFPVLFKSKVSARDKALFARQLATMISSGLELAKAIKLTSVQGRTDKIKALYLDIYQNIEEGNSFSSSLARHPEAFDAVFVSVVRAGENTGRLDTVLDQLANQLENDNNFVAKVKGAMYYPAFILLALIGIGSYMMIKVIPQLKSIFDSMGAQLPLATRILVWLSDFMVQRWWALLIILLIIIFFSRYWLGSSQGGAFVDQLQIKTPGVKGLFEGIYMYRFSQIMSMLIGAGVPLLDSLKIAGTTIQNEIYSKSIDRIVEQVEKGVPLSSQLSKEVIFPPLVAQMASVGEETGQLDKVFQKVASFYEESTNQSIKTISTLIEPIILVIMGMGVAFIIFAVLVPIYNIAQLQ